MAHSLREITDLMSTKYLHKIRSIPAMWHTGLAFPFFSSVRFVKQRSPFVHCSKWLILLTQLLWRSMWLILCLVPWRDRNPGNFRKKTKQPQSNVFCYSHRLWGLEQIASCWKIFSKWGNSGNERTTLAPYPCLHMLITYATLPQSTTVKLVTWANFKETD